jgi:TetR/AcrR family transcriptional regulator
MSNPKINIRRKNIEKILLAAEKIFAIKGYAGTVMADIAQEAELPRSNLHYYFSTKEELYREVLINLLGTWELEGACFERYDDPRVVLTSFIMEKMTHSRTRPHGSKLWANEIIGGAPLFSDMLDEHLAKGAKFKEAKIRQWIEEKRIRPVDPSALLYMIWASTQHYADFDYQVKVLNGHKALSDQQFEQAVQTITEVVLRGIGLEP